MENASKALILASSVMIGILILSFFVYIFNRFGITSRTTDEKLAQREIDAFNAKFSNYDTGGEHKLEDTFSITTVRRNETKSISYKNLFNSGVSPEEDYKKALVSASQNLRTIADVVSCINDAIDINYTNSNGYRYGVEKVASVEVIVDLSECTLDSSIFKETNRYKYLLIEPNASVKPKFIYGTNGSLASGANNTENKEQNIASFSPVNQPKDDGGNAVNVYDILKEFNFTTGDKTNTKTILSEGKMYIVNRYYFIGQVFYNSYTELVETVKFKLVENKKFDSIP